MDENISKSSILIGKELLSSLVDHLHSFNPEENEKAKFQIVNLSIQGTLAFIVQVLWYSRKIVI